MSSSLIAPFGRQQLLKESSNRKRELAYGVSIFAYMLRYVQLSMSTLQKN